MTRGLSTRFRNGNRSRTAVTGMAVLLLVPICLKGCSTGGWKLFGDPDKELKFSHFRHREHVEDCNECHYDPATKKAIAAGHPQCVECHESAAEGVEADRRCLLCHKTLTPEKTKPTERPDYAIAIFGHPEHETVSCAECHGPIDKRISLDRANYPRMEDCLDCHFPNLTEKSSAQCALCHATLNADVKPENHNQPEWQIVHGPWRRNNPELCSRCHVQSRDCDACHSRERPRSHTATFRLKTHGFHAMSDPLRCETCHRQDFCEACHRTTEPRTHTPSFKRQPWMHCAICHIPLEEGNRCAVCHVGDPHAAVLAKSPPPQLIAAGLIDPSEPCLPCHPVELVPITHPYNTISPLDCVQCHRPR